MIVQQMRSYVMAVGLLGLTGCAVVPTGPSVLVLPSQGKSFEQFQAEDMACRQWAGQQIGMTAQDTINQNTATSAAVGTAIGAGAGALLGAASGHPGTGAAIGAGSGLLLGTATGAGAGEAYGYDAQQRYDYAYVQCMYAKGHQVPGQVHRYRLRRATPSYPPPPPSYGYPVPPDYVPSYPYYR